MTQPHSVVHFGVLLKLNDFCHFACIFLVLQMHFSIFSDRHICTFFFLHFLAYFCLLLHIFLIALFNRVPDSASLLVTQLLPLWCLALSCLLSRLPSLSSSNTLVCS